MIAFTCAGCGKPFPADDGHAGRRSRCKRCGTMTTIPMPAGLPLLEVPVPAPITEVSPPRTPRRRKPKAIGRDAWTSLGIGLGLAVIALLIPLVGFIADVLITVIHELGHVATAWIFGSPAVPSFDLSYGGGVSYTFGRQPILILLIYAAFAALAFRKRSERPALLHDPGRRRSLFRRCLLSAPGSPDHGDGARSGAAVRRRVPLPQLLRQQPDPPLDQERPLCAFLGLYIVLAQARFAYLLITSHEHREEYGLAKGGGDWMDFSRIANEHLHVRLEVVAGLFPLIVCSLGAAGCLFLFSIDTGGAASSARTSPRRISTKINVGRRCDSKKVGAIGVRSGHSRSRENRTTTGQRRLSPWQANRSAAV